MQIPNGLGAVLALLVLVLVVVLSNLGQMPGGLIIALMLGMLALARLT